VRLRCSVGVVRNDPSRRLVGIVCNDPSRKLVRDGVRGDCPLFATQGHSRARCITAPGPAMVATVLWAPVSHSQTAKVEVATKTLYGAGGRTRGAGLWRGHGRRRGVVFARPGVGRGMVGRGRLGAARWGGHGSGEIVRDHVGGGVVAARDLEGWCGRLDPHPRRFASRPLPLAGEVDGWPRPLAAGVLRQVYFRPVRRGLDGARAGRHGFGTTPPGACQAPSV
jgi:hypothetical protein